MQINKLLVQDFMTTSVISVRPTTTLAAAYATMMDKDIRRLPVINSQGELLGLITLSDIQRLAPLSNQAEDVPAQRPSRLTNIKIRAEFPNGDTQCKRQALLRVAQHCPVHETIKTIEHVDFEIV